MKLLSKAEVYGLEDGELCRVLMMFQASPAAASILATPWERRFAEGVADYYVRKGGLTWQQRRAARGIVCKFVEEQARRAEVQVPVCAPEKVTRRDSDHEDD